jgi:hypothetical protein
MEGGWNESVEEVWKVQGGTVEGVMGGGGVGGPRTSHSKFACPAQRAHEKFGGFFLDCELKINRLSAPWTPPTKARKRDAGKAGGAEE